MGNEPGGQALSGGAANSKHRGERRAAIKRLTSGQTLQIVHQSSKFGPGTPGSHRPMQRLLRLALRSIIAPQRAQVGMDIHPWVPLIPNCAVGDSRVGIPCRLKV